MAALIDETISRPVMDQSTAFLARILPNRAGRFADRLDTALGLGLDLSDVQLPFADILLLRTQCVSHALDGQVGQIHDIERCWGGNLP